VTKISGSDDRVWSAEERLLIRLVDELHDTSAISDGLWGELAAAFSVEQIFELIALVGFYHRCRSSRTA
jgi:4-carboxymuconolactone decarboxylase